MRQSKLFSILLLLCVTAPFAITFTWFHYQKKQVKKQVKASIVEGINRSELVHLQFTTTFASEHLQWVHQTEFEYNGRMFDIVEQETNGDTITYWCWEDRAETKLNTQLKKMVTQAMDMDPQKKQHKQRLLNFCLNLYHSEANQWQVTESAQGYLSSHYKANNYTSLSLPPPSPPPQFG